MDEVPRPCKLRYSLTPHSISTDFSNRYPSSQYIGLTCVSHALRSEFKPLYDAHHSASPTIPLELLHQYFEAFPLSTAEVSAHNITAVIAARDDLSTNWNLVPFLTIILTPYPWQPPVCFLASRSSGRIKFAKHFLDRLPDFGALLQGGNFSSIDLFLASRTEYFPQSYGTSTTGRLYIEVIMTPITGSWKGKEHEEMQFQEFVKKFSLRLPVRCLVGERELCWEPETGIDHLQTVSIIVKTLKQK
jgi:hypothetical protein